MDLELIKLCEEHLETVRQWRMMPEVTKYMYTDPNISAEDQREWFKGLENDSRRIYWIIYFEGRPVGLINLYDIDTLNKTAMWAYYLGDVAVRGKGIGKSLECNIYDFCFDRLGLNKLSCEVFSSNEKVVALHQKYGSKIEGILKQQIFKNGEFHDIARMAIIKAAWDEVRPQHQYDKIEIKY